MNGSSFWLRLINFFDLTKLVLIAAVIVITALFVIASPIAVSGDSMLPNFTNGQAVAVEHISYWTSNSIRRGDVVAARFPADPDRTKLIKRVVGLPGEKVSSQHGRIFIDSLLLDESAYAPRFGPAPYVEAEPITLGANEYFLVGDNRPGSSDSRLWGPVQAADIIGRVSIVIWPPSQIQYVNRP